MNGSDTHVYVCMTYVCTMYMMACMHICMYVCMYVRMYTVCMYMYVICKLTLLYSRLGDGLVKSRTTGSSSKGLRSQRAA